MTGMEDVLAAHAVTGISTYLAVTCLCDFTYRSVTGHAMHVAQELTKAGYGSQHDAWHEGYTVGNAHNGRRDANPYPKVSES